MSACRSPSGGADRSSDQAVPNPGLQGRSGGDDRANVPGGLRCMLRTGRRHGYVCFVSPRSLERGSGVGHGFIMGLAHIFDLGDQFRGQLSLGQPAVPFLRAPLP